MKHKKIIFLIFFVVLVLAVAAVSFGDSTWERIGRRDSASNANSAILSADSPILATIQGEAYRSSGFETMLGDYALLGNEKDPDEYARSLIFDELLLREAKSRGFSVNKSELTQYMEQTKSALEQSPETKETLEEYLRGLGMTEKEYWAACAEVYEKWLLTMKLDEALRQEYFEENPSANDEDFHDYYMNEYQESLFESYEVVMQSQGDSVK